MSNGLRALHMNEAINLVISDLTHGSIHLNKIECIPLSNLGDPSGLMSRLFDEDEEKEQQAVIHELDLTLTKT